MSMPRRFRRDIVRQNQLEIIIEVHTQQVEYLFFFFTQTVLVCDLFLRCNDYKIKIIILLLFIRRQNVVNIVSLSIVEVDVVINPYLFQTQLT